MRRGMVVAWCVLLGCVIFSSRLAQAAVHHLSPDDDWFSVIACDGCSASDLLQPGDEVILESGVYSDSRRINLFHRGTADSPIVIRAADGATPVFERPVELNPFTSQDHVLNFEGSQYLTLRGVEVRGGTWGIRIGSTLRPSGTPLPIHAQLVDPGPLTPDWAKYITLEDLYIHDTGLTAITANMDGDLYEGIVIRNNEITRLGQGDAGVYVGCNNLSGGVTSCVFRDGLIEGNFIHDIDGVPGVGDGIQIKDGSYNNIVRNNVIHTTGTFGAVGILVYGTDGNAPNILEGNVIWNAGDNAIQAASEVIIRNNIIFSAGLNGIQSQNHQSAVPGNLTIVGNTVISDNDALSITPPSGGLSGPIVVANNALYATAGGRGIRWPGSGDVTISGNVGVGTSFPALGTAAWDPSGNLLSDFGDIASMDAFPVALSKLIGVADSAYLPQIDFNGMPRAGSLDVGAYVYDPAGNPGWTIESDFKPPVLMHDMDFSGLVDFDDIEFFVLGLSDESAYEALFGVPPVLRGDSDGNGLFDFDDISGFVATLGGGDRSVGAVPEPSTLLLLGITACYGWLVRRHQDKE